MISRQWQARADHEPIVVLHLNRRISFPDSLRQSLKIRSEKRSASTSMNWRPALAPQVCMLLRERTRLPGGNVRSLSSACQIRMIISFRRLRNRSLPIAPKIHDCSIHIALTREFPVFGDASILQANAVQLYRSTNHMTDWVWNACNPAICYRREPIRVSQRRRPKGFRFVYADGSWRSPHVAI